MLVTHHRGGATGVRRQTSLSADFGWEDIPQQPAGGCGELLQVDFYRRPGESHVDPLV